MDSWLVMHRDVFVEYLERAKAGEDPEALFVEFYAEGDSEYVPAAEDG